jgi:hypothetical protein
MALSSEKLRTNLNLLIEKYVLFPEKAIAGTRSAFMRAFRYDLTALQIYQAIVVCSLLPLGCWWIVTSLFRRPQNDPIWLRRPTKSDKGFQVSTNDGASIEASGRFHPARPISASFNII